VRRAVCREQGRARRCEVSALYRRVAACADGAQGGEGQWASTILVLRELIALGSNVSVVSCRAPLHRPRGSVEGVSSVLTAVPP
jgi:hypothetical protein